MNNIFTKSLIIINIFLLAIVAFLFLRVSKEIDQLSSRNTAQSVVLCNYIEDLQSQTGIDRKVSPNCQGDIEWVFKRVSDGFKP